MGLFALFAVWRGHIVKRFENVNSESDAMNEFSSQAHVAHHRILQAAAAAISCCPESFLSLWCY